MTSTSVPALRGLRGGHYLRPDGEWDDVSLSIDGGGLLSHEHTQSTWLDTSGCLVLPGIVDFHGDAFERQIMPRPKVRFPLDIALLDTDRQLAANGITTAMHGLTYSWEGGLRGRETAIEFFNVLDDLVLRLSVEHLVHLRFECHNVCGEADTLAWLAEGRISVLAFNDHLPGMLRKVDNIGKMQEYADRAFMDVSGFIDRMNMSAQRTAETPAMVQRLAAMAREHAIPMASHDDESIAVRQQFAELGVNISEFPLNWEVARAATEVGHMVVCGAPNVLRGGSHIGAPRAADLVGEGLCPILASDYYYPAPLFAAFRLASQRIVPLAQAWRLVSTHPAAALNLRDRGALAKGKRADIVVIDAHDLHTPRLIATICGGNLVYLNDSARLHA